MANDIVLAIELIATQVENLLKPMKSSWQKIRSPEVGVL